MTLPPGQRAVDGFPRFGTHLHQPPPVVPLQPMLALEGAVQERRVVPLRELDALAQRSLDADFHCVGGWSAVGLHWEGVAFRDVWREMLEPLAMPGVTHVVFGGLDGYWSSMMLEDALADDVLLARRLDGRDLGGDHGAPLRLVCPAHYGFVNAKHVCRIELCTSEPATGYGTTTRFSSIGLKVLWFRRHPRARVWLEERHRHLPGPVVRPLYRALVKPIALLSARGSRP
jgi:DMSO/TMAO reductase YedYZ molybdopterin-dependent catalytic subunit